MKAAKGSTKRALEALALNLQVEYRFIFYYPCLARLVPDDGTREIVLVLGEESVRHADAVVQVIRALGGTPPFPSIDTLPDLPAKELFRKQLEYEKLALVLHTQAAELVESKWRESLHRLAEAERRHIAAVEKILERLG